MEINRNKKKVPKTPWADYMDGVPLHLQYFEGSMYDKVAETALKYGNNIAFTFLGKSTTYKQMMINIEKCARSLKTLGVRENDKVTIAMPNCPQAIYMFYAVNMIGAISNVIHPLSAEKEIEFFLNESESITAITIDQFYSKFENVRRKTKVVNIIIASIKDELSKPIRAGYMLTEAFSIEKIPSNAPVIRWKEFIKLSKHCFYNYRVNKKSDDVAVILYSGGTTGTTKGIELTNKNFNALAQQVVAANPMFRPGDKMLAAMPLFHGFGLGVCIHTMLAMGGRCILIPRFTPKSYAKDLVKYKCNHIAGVPTLYEALLSLPKMKHANLSCLKGVYCGGDSLSIDLKKKIDAFLYEHHSMVQVREGYGATEAVNACCLTPVYRHKVGSIGVPLPDMYFKIINPENGKEMPYGEEGEIVISGPTVMKGYMNNPKETKLCLKKHSDGLTWLYTGDLGVMDDEGFLFFKGRAKRMIICSGYNVYPSQIEQILDSYEAIHMSCVIGVPDPYRIQRPKVFVQLEKGFEPSDELKERILKYLKKHIAKYAMPKELEFLDELPKTKVGKIAYRELEEAELNKINNSKQNNTND